LLASRRTSLSKKADVDDDAGVFSEFESPEESASRRALGILGLTGGGGLLIGALLKLLRSGMPLPYETPTEEALPGRFIMQLPFKQIEQEPGRQRGRALAKKSEDQKKEAFSLSDIPLVGETLSGAWRGAKETAQDVWGRAMEVSEPRHVPWFLPLMALLGPAAVYGGYRGTDWLADALRNRSIDEELKKAKREYEEALASQYQAGKQASIAEAVDGLALAHATGEFSRMEKSAVTSDIDTELAQATDSVSGIGRTGINIYLMLAALLAAGAHFGTKGYVEKQDPQRARFEALQQLIRRQQIGRAPAFTFETS
jgi:hypothetical protein